MKKMHDIINRIIGVCLLLDEKAQLLYEMFSRDSKNEDLKTFWRLIACEEGAHVRFWKIMEKYSLAGDIPDFFADSDLVYMELENCIPKVQGIFDSYEVDKSVYNTFTLAFQMEYIELHPAIETFFAYAHTLALTNSPHENYITHLSKFICGFREHHGKDAVMELLSDTLLTLYRKNRLLSHISTTDELTGFFNRRDFFNAIKPVAYMAQRMGTHVGILIANIDNLKKINDESGQSKGDRILSIAGNSIQSSIRASDIAGRYSKEDVIVFFPNIKLSAMARIAEKIRKSIINDTQFIIPATISIGISEGLLETDVLSGINSLSKEAEHYLHIAKADGKNRIIAKGMY